MVGHWLWYLIVLIAAQHPSMVSPLMQGKHSDLQAHSQLWLRMVLSIIFSIRCCFPEIVISNGTDNFRDGAKLLKCGETVDEIVPNCASSANLYQNDRYIRNSNICEGSASYNAAEWSSVPVSNIGDLPPVADSYNYLYCHLRLLDRSQK